MENYSIKKKSKELNSASLELFAGSLVILTKIIDLNVTNTNIWKYVDDTTLAECVEKNATSSMQSRVD